MPFTDCHQYLIHHTLQPLRQLLRSVARGGFWHCLGDRPHHTHIASTYGPTSIESTHPHIHRSRPRRDVGTRCLWRRWTRAMRCAAGLDFYVSIMFNPRHDRPSLLTTSHTHIYVYKNRSAGCTTTSTASATASTRRRAWSRHHRCSSPRAPSPPASARCVRVCVKDCLGSLSIRLQPSQR